MSTTFFVPRETTVIALGADQVAAAIAAQLKEDDKLVRNGSRGLFWLEPLLEIETDGERIAFGPVKADEVPEILRAVAAGRHAVLLAEDHAEVLDVLEARAVRDPVPPSGRMPAPGV